MALHPSLVDLGELAARCESPAAARGILAEAQDLVRNAVDHREDEVALAAWFSRVLADVLRSPGLDSPVRLTGAAATGDAVPTTTIYWLGEDSDLEELFASVGLKATTGKDSAANRVDAGLPVGTGGEEQLLEEALAQRPQPLRVVDGLPDRDVLVDVRAHLLSPIAAIARWAAPAPRPTPDRIAIGHERELLTSSQRDALTQAWETGLALELRNWRDHVDGHPLRLGDLPPLDRTAYGAACRMVAAVFDGLQASQN
ncbi:hypothetical protein [Corynebacterium sp. SA-MJD20WY100]|uniref:hypothetical protein n=1 Tax=Corynebacterium sp. SA-MJD20WY100 TaxID=3142969 RepID=UPI003221E44E